MGAPLPILRSLDDCIDYQKTVAQFWPHFLELPKEVLNVLPDVNGLVLLYMGTNPLMFGLAFALFLGVIFTVAAEINKNYSQVDRFWSILPSVYIGHFTLWAHLNGLPTDRLDLLMAVSTLWSTRLTFNYWRRGGYSIGSEDYRWVIVQKYTGDFLFRIFNATFIGPYQCVLLYSVTTPAYIMLLLAKQGGPGLLGMDYVLAGIMVFFILSSFISDQQQYNYQTAKYKYKDTGKVTDGYLKDDLERGFNTKGLFSLSRHPNFASEQSVWLTLYWWSCNLTSDSHFYNWTGIGAIMYLLLFQGSTWLTELITAGKYPEYNEYKQQVGMFLPISGRGYAPPKETAKKIK